MCNAPEKVGGASRVLQLLQNLVQTELLAVRLQLHRSGGGGECNGRVTAFVTGV